MLVWNNIHVYKQISHVFVYVSTPVLIKKKHTHHFSFSAATSPLLILLASLDVVVILFALTPGAWSSTSVQDVPRWVSLAMWSGGPKVWRCDVGFPKFLRMDVPLGSMASEWGIAGVITHLLALYQLPWDIQEGFWVVGFWGLGILEAEIIPLSSVWNIAGETHL